MRWLNLLADQTSDIIFSVTNLFFRTILVFYWLLAIKNIKIFIGLLVSANIIISVHPYTIFNIISKLKY